MALTKLQGRGCNMDADIARASASEARLPRKEAAARDVRTLANAKTTLSAELTAIDKWQV